MVEMKGMKQEMPPGERWDRVRITRDALPKTFLVQTESTITTTMGRFNIYPGDRVETGDPISLVIRRDSHDYRIAWDIVCDIDLMENVPAGASSSNYP